MEEALKVLNELEAEGVIGKFAIGGAMGMLFYAEPVATYHLGIFCHVPSQTGLIISMTPVYAALAKKGYFPNDAEQVDIGGMPVQFLVPSPGLVEEALEQAVDQKIFGVPTHVFTYEHLLAIMVSVGRVKDKLRIAQCIEQAPFDEDRLKSILERYQLLDKWAKIVE